MTRKYPGWTGDQNDPMLHELVACLCTPEAIDHIILKYRNVNLGSPYPIEWYQDKDNFLEGKSTGHLRFESGKMVWVKHESSRFDA